jgi:hypothetical protein
MAEIELPNPEETREKAQDPFMKRVALLVAVYAVVLALAALGGSNASKDMMMNQMQATNAWNRYQAKTMREVLYEKEKEDLGAALVGENEALTADSRLRREARLAKVTQKLTEYTAEKESISKEAREFEHERDVAQKQDPYFDGAETLLQIAVVMASVAMLSGKRWAFLASLGLASVGSVLTIIAYAIPRMH